MSQLVRLLSPEEAEKRRKEVREDFIEEHTRAIENGGTPRASVEKLTAYIRSESLDD